MTDIILEFTFFNKVNSKQRRKFSSP